MANFGFTLMEITVAIALMLGIFVLGSVFSMNSYRQYSFYTNRITLVTTLQSARRMSIDNVDQKSHGVHVSTLGATLFSGGSFVATSSENILFPFTMSVLATGTMDIIFEQLTGNTASSSFSISDGARQIAITTNHEGMLNW